MTIQPGAQAEVVHLVTDADTASAVGSGDVPVLATPRLLALMESAAMAAVAAGGLDAGLGAGRTTVGTRVDLEHRAPTPVGTRIAVHAEVVAVEGRELRFRVEAQHPADGRVVASGELTRVVVDRERFVNRAGA